MEEVVNADFKKCRQFMLFEPPIMLYFFAQAVAVFATGNCSVYHSYQVQLGAGNEVCTTVYKSIAEESQPYGTPMLMVQSFVDALIPAILVLFLGSWSDKDGRKPILVACYAVTFTGESLVHRCYQAQSGTNSKGRATHYSDSTVLENTPWLEMPMLYFIFIAMVAYFISAFIVACPLLFLGPWSDKYGRKPILLAGYAGSATSFFLWSILSSTNLHSRFYLIASLPALLVGDPGSVSFATYCYITDITSDRQRAWHLTWQLLANYVGMFFALFAGSAIYEGYGYPGIFGVASASSAISMLYVLIFVPETVTTNRENAYRSLFDLSLIKDTLATCVRKREDTNRLMLWLCILYLSMMTLADVGDFRMIRIASEGLGWKENDHMVYQIMERILSIVGVLLSAKIITSFIDKSMSNMLIVAFALTALLSGTIAKEFATESWHLYLSVVLAMYGHLAEPVLRAALSKSVPPRDTGKVFSLASFMELVMFHTTRPFYADLYSYPMRPARRPSLIFIITADIYVNAIVWVMPIYRKFQLWNSAREQHSRRDVGRTKENMD